MKTDEARGSGEKQFHSSGWLLADNGWQKTANNSANGPLFERHYPVFAGTVDYTMERITSHKDLVVWQRSVALACKVYAEAGLLPREERFGLQTQLKRAAISIPSNIAEGSARRSRAEFIQHLHISRGSLAELETHYMIVSRLQLLGGACATLEEIAEVGRLLNGLIRSLVSSNQAAHAKACAHQPPAANR